MSYNTKNVMNGAYGKVWVDGILAFDVKEASVTVAVNREDVRMSGTVEVDTKISSTKGSGSFTVNKVFTRFSERLVAGLAIGQERVVQLRLSVKDPDNKGREEWQIIDAKLDGDFDVMNFSIDSLMEQSFNFVFKPSNLIPLSVAVNNGK